MGNISTYSRTVLIVYGLELLSQKISIIDFWLGSKYVSVKILIVSHTIWETKLRVKPMDDLVA